MSGSVRIRRYADVPKSAALADAIDAIFFDSSQTKSFANHEERAAFRERWLGRYLREHPQFAYLAIEDDGTAVGYLVGSDEPPKPETNPFRDFPQLTSHFPAHLHLNVAPGSRNKGYGARLIETFLADLRTAKSPGVHVVTSAQSPNVRFYKRCGFGEVAAPSIAPELVFLARAL